MGPTRLGVTWTRWFGAGREDVPQTPRSAPASPLGRGTAGRDARPGCLDLPYDVRTTPAGGGKSLGAPTRSTPWAGSPISPLDNVLRTGSTSRSSSAPSRGGQASAPLRELPRPQSANPADIATRGGDSPVLARQAGARNFGPNPEFPEGNALGGAIWRDPVARSAAWRDPPEEPPEEEGGGGDAPLCAECYHAHPLALCRAPGTVTLRTGHTVERICGCYLEEK